MADGYVISNAAYQALADTRPAIGVLYPRVPAFQDLADMHRPCRSVSTPIGTNTATKAGAKFDVLLWQKGV